MTIFVRSFVRSSIRPSFDVVRFVRFRSISFDSDRFRPISIDLVRFRKRVGLLEEVDIYVHV